MLRIPDGAVCNLTAFRMCAHNGTHVDAPYHFIESGKKVDEIALERFVGGAYVAAREGDLTAEGARELLEEAREAEELAGPAAAGASRRILVKGNCVVTEGAAKVFADRGILLFGTESQAVGPENAPIAVHLIMLGAQIALLEGVRLGEVEEGAYLLCAAPLKLEGAEGAPCRAVLISL